MAQGQKGRPPRYTFLDPPSPPPRLEQDRPPWVASSACHREQGVSEVSASSYFAKLDVPHGQPIDQAPSVHTLLFPFSAIRGSVDRVPTCWLDKAGLNDDDMRVFASLLSRDGSATQTLSEQCSKASYVVQEWNQHFFHQRGCHLEVRVASHAPGGVAETGCEECHAAELKYWMQARMGNASIKDDTGDENDVTGMEDRQSEPLWVKAEERRIQAREALAYDRAEQVRKKQGDAKAEKILEKARKERRKEMERLAKQRKKAMVLA